MTIDDMFSKLWTAYPSDLAHKRRGSKPSAIRAFKKIAPDEQEFNRMMDNMRSQVRNDRKEKNPMRWPYVSSYLNGAMYDDYIETVQTTEKREEAECNVVNCRNPVHGPMYKHCSTHVENAHSDLLAVAFRKTGIKYGSPDFVNECRKACRISMNKLTGKMNDIK